MFTGKLFAGKWFTKIALRKLFAKIVLRKLFAKTVLRKLEIVLPTKCKFVSVIQKTPRGGQFTTSSTPPLSLPQRGDLCIVAQRCVCK